jgi:hypothetical protein
MIKKFWQRIKTKIFLKLLHGDFIVYEGMLWGKQKARMGLLHLHIIARKHKGSQAILLIRRDK